MASCITSHFGNSYSPQVKLTVTQSGETSTTATLSWTLEYITNGYTATTNSNSRAWSVTIDGSTVDSGSTYISGKTTYTIKSGTKTVSKKAARSVSFGLSFYFDISWGSATGSEEYAGTKTASGSIAISAATYTVSYDKNGGNGTMSASTATYGSAFITRQNTFTKTGHTFDGWNERSDGTGTDWPLTGAGTYESGESWKWDYTSNITLYAQWSANTYTITYDVGEDSEAPEPTTYIYADNGTVSLSDTKPTRTGYTFLGWQNEDGSELYDSGGTFNKNIASNTTLYAIWRENLLTINYKSNYATYAKVDGVENEEVDANKKDVVVRTSAYTYASSVDDGLHNYSSADDDTYMKRVRYDALGFWGTEPEIESGISIHEDTPFATGAELAGELGVLSELEVGDVEIDLYALWVLLASRVTIFDENGNDKRGMVHFYVDDVIFGTSNEMDFADSNEDDFITSNDVNFITSDEMIFVDANSDYFITANTNLHYGIITIFDEHGDPHVAI